MAKLDTIMMTKSADILAPNWPLYSFSEAERAQITSRGSAVVRSTLLALKAGVPPKSVDPEESMSERINNDCMIVMENPTKVYEMGSSWPFKLWFFSYRVKTPK